MLHIPWQDAFCLPQTCQEGLWHVLTDTNKLSIKENYAYNLAPHKVETSSQNSIKIANS